MLEYVYFKSLQINTHLISLAISSSVSRLLLSMNMRKNTMATSPTIDPSVAAAIMPVLEAGKQIPDQNLHKMRFIDMLLKKKNAVQWDYIQVITSRLMEQLSEPAVLLARQMYFPDMLLVRLLSRRVPCFSSAEQPQIHTHTHITIIHLCDPSMWARYN